MSVESGGPGGPPDDFNLYNVTHRGEMPTLKQSQSRNYKALKVAFFTHPSDTEKYFVIGGEEIRKLNIFEIHRGLKCISSENFKIITRLNSGDLLLQTSSTQQIDCLKNLTSFGVDKKPVTISENGALNKSQAIIRCREIMKLDMETIQEGLKDQKVVHVQRLKRRENSTWVDTATHILTFDSPICPAEINVGYLVVKTELYIPSPFRCVICQRLGHTKKRCDSKKNTPTCGYCAKPLHGNEEPCPGPVKCVNCLGNHPSSSRACPKFIEEKEINAIRVTMRIPYKLAREELKKRKFVQPAAHMKPTAPDNQSKKTFASTLKSETSNSTSKPDLSINQNKVTKRTSVSPSPKSPKIKQPKVPKITIKEHKRQNVEERLNASLAEKSILNTPTGNVSPLKETHSQKTDYSLTSSPTNSSQKNYSLTRQTISADILLQFKGFDNSPLTPSRPNLPLPSPASSLSPDPKPPDMMDFSDENSSSSSDQISDECDNNYK